MFGSNSRSTDPQQYLTRDLRLAAHLCAFGFSAEVVRVDPRTVAYRFRATPTLLTEANSFAAGQARAEPVAFDKFHKELRFRTIEALRAAQRGATP